MKVYLIAAISADGFIAPKNNQQISSTSWTSKEDTAWFNKKTKEIGTVIMGRTTWDTIPAKYRPLKDRLNIIYTSQPGEVENSIPLTEFKNQKSKIKNLTLTTDMSPNNLVTYLSDLGVDKIALCGGTSVYTQFLKAGLIDELFLTVEPIIFGTGTPLFDKELTTKLHLVETIELSDQTKVLHHKII